MLTSTDYAILAALDDIGGAQTGEVSARARISYGGNQRQRSGAVRSWLVRLKKEGLVELADDRKPDIWRRTKAGTLTLFNPQLTRTGWPLSETACSAGEPARCSWTARSPSSSQGS